MNEEPDFVSLSEKINIELAGNLTIEVIMKSESFFSFKVNKILKVDLVNDVRFRYGKLIKSKIFSKVDNVENMLSNKLSALISRDEVKDVVDIWVIAKNTKINWKSIFLSANSKAVGIFPPDVSRKLIDFPIDLLKRIKWVDKAPNSKEFRNDVNRICDSMLKVN